MWFHTSTWKLLRVFTLLTLTFSHECCLEYLHCSHYVVSHEHMNVVESIYSAHTDLLIILVMQGLLDAVRAVLQVQDILHPLRTRCHTALCTDVWISLFYGRFFLALFNAFYGISTYQQLFFSRLN